MRSELAALSEHQPQALTGETVTFTGTLASMTHEQASAQVVAHGGQAVPHMSRQVTLLVVGEEGWPLEADGRPSVKLQQAEALILEAHPLRIISESDWLQIIQLSVENPEVKRLYTPAMLSQLLKLPVHLIRSWERAGLIRAEKRVFRLPYFSYQEVTTARRLSELMQAGATQQQLARSLRLVQKYVGEPGRAFEQLEMLSDHRSLVVRDQKGYFDPQSRQRLFSFSASPKTDEEQDGATLAAEEESDAEDHRFLRFEMPPNTAVSSTDWMVEGCRRAEVADTSGAIRCFRRALRARPEDAEAHFYLADSLYRLGKQEASLERYLCAIEHDPEYLEAWTQIGCLYAELRKWSEAIEAFDAAIEIHPTFAEAHLHKAETLYQMHQPEDAIRHWQLYLQNDDRGPWVELAYQRLEQFGVPISGE
ncbi:tetratricopeptide repeat protein [Rubinisphaera margarita]|uniref:tetratricopeptide repeat protein n=1 Tax=Rubinisphaera margarita TaxID=2909586 RepID=UPI001EE7CBB6|nr:tetratricopeptide repeat protein [Rubinisphaera margarita]MCG6154575.1 tetratricopeptide repeat protein [Rubinisphaera margarita]